MNFTSLKLPTSPQPSLKAMAGTARLWRTRRRKGKILLLLSFACLGQLYAMEPQEPMGTFGELPADVRTVIVQKAIASSNTIEDAIKAIKVASILQGVRYDNLNDFTKLVHILADKFNTGTAEVATKFETSTAKEYLELGNKLSSYMAFQLTPPIVEIVKRLINKGADVNFTEIQERKMLDESHKMINIKIVKNKPLFKATHIHNWQAIKLLLEYGLQPTEWDLAFLNSNQQAMLNQLIEEAMKK